ncbi:uncharacterized protein BDR25DRAFT_349313 [Lindgomyces ingoldianus]|uniref:Uncharacterized protein n=1 Tax=Lindgomyces ingoldianus TaxID=673940 RepID=A0ACB6RAR8_9PLEO|nr:uncharacterized protein BDR25DRAFT_349313 [Lindgomyces ingoldianus]KAF2476192.1 hypothetical protein BDR25DRAFT_349313 [Lindgomyces ingoldianus]
MALIWPSESTSTLPYMMLLNGRLRSVLSAHRGTLLLDPIFPLFPLPIIHSPVQPSKLHHSKARHARPLHLLVLSAVETFDESFATNDAPQISTEYSELVQFTLHASTTITRLSSMDIRPDPLSVPLSSPRTAQMAIQMEIKGYQNCKTKH